MIVSIKELRQKTKEIIDLVENGNSVVITYRGSKKARVVPLKSSFSKTNLGFGMWSDRTGIDNSSEYVKSMRKGRCKW